jgi:hypothetical protein
VWHEWVTDPWLKGSWSQFGPDFYTKYWPELLKPHGNVEFASAGALSCCPPFSQHLADLTSLLFTDYPVHGWKGCAFPFSPLSLSRRTDSLFTFSFLDGAISDGARAAQQVIKKSPHRSRL